MQGYYITDGSGSPLLFPNNTLVVNLPSIALVDSVAVAVEF